MKIQKIKLGEKIHFKWMDREHGGQSLGWAYFDVCQVWKNGKLKKIYIYPRQQRSEVFYSYDLPEDYKAVQFDISSYNCETEASVKSNNYCKEHKGITSSMIVPKGAEYFSLSLHFGNSLCMDYHKERSEKNDLFS